MVGWEVKVMRIIDEDGIASEGGDIGLLLLLFEGDGDLIHEVLGELSLVDGDR
jgi:hypothetical protein